MIVSVDVGTKEKRIDISTLANIGCGGEGEIYDCPEIGCVLKIFYSPIDDQAVKISRLENCMKHSAILFEGLDDFATVPKMLATGEGLLVNAQGQVYPYYTVGYGMENCSGWWNLSDILTNDFCHENGIGLKHKTWIFCELHRAVRFIHSKGFIIGDLNASNVLIKLEDRKCQVRIIDTDSWGMNRPDLDLTFDPSAIDREVMHPDQMEAQERGNSSPAFSQKYDWWAFAYLLTRCLVGKDPFSEGNYHSMSRDERIFNKITIWHGGIRLNRYDAISSVRIGPKMRQILKRFLTCAVEGEFPIDVLTELYAGIKSCGNCDMKFHRSLCFCPNCATVL